MITGGLVSENFNHGKNVAYKLHQCKHCIRRAALQTFTRRTASADFSLRAVLR